MPVRVAMVGAGSMAREHLKAFAAVPCVSLSGIFSRTAAKAQTLATEFKIPHVCNNVTELHEHSRADIVVVAVPELAARSVAQACFEHPWTILMEKPAGYNLADAEAILAAAQRKKRRVFVALNRRFLSSTRSALDDLQSNPGSRFIHVQDQQSLDTARAIGHPPEVVAHWMYANSVHLVDYLRVFGRGAITAVKPMQRWEPGTAVLLATVEFASGDLGLYSGIWQGPGPWAVTVSTPAKRWEMRPLEQAQFQLAGERRLQPVEMHVWDREFKPGFRLQAEEVVKAVRGEPSLAPTLDQATETMRLIGGIFGFSH
jgi:predicted dehydrogenase